MVNEPFGEILKAALAPAGWPVIAVDGTATPDKDAFIEAVADAARFPEWAGRNWDAMEELLRDLSWLAPEPTTDTSTGTAPGFVFLWSAPEVLAAGNPNDAEIARSILRDCAAWWAERGVTFAVLIQDWPDAEARFGAS